MFGKSAILIGVGKGYKYRKTFLINQRQNSLMNY